MATVRLYTQPDLITFDQCQGLWIVTPGTFVYFDCTDGAITAQLVPAAWTQPGDTAIVGKWDAGPNIVTIVPFPGSGDQLDGAANRTRTTQFSFLKVWWGTPPTSVYGQGAMTG